MRNTVTLIALAALLTAGLIQILRARFAANDLLPEYSTLRVDPQGLTVLFEALAATGAVPVSRSNRPPALLKNSDATLVFAGADRFGWLASDEPISGLETLARRGNRVVVALGRSVMRFEPAGTSEPMRVKWGVRVLAIPGNRHDDQEDAPARWPSYFQAGPEWHVLTKDPEGRALVLERKFDSGSIVLLASAWPLTNEAMVQDRRSELLATLFNARPRIIFDESHLGLQETGTVMAMGARFHMQGFLSGLLVLACLFVWRNLASFPPDRSLPAPRIGRDSLSGLSILLARNVPENKLIETCLAKLAPDRRVKAYSTAVNAKDTVETFEAIRQQLHPARPL